MKHRFVESSGVIECMIAGESVEIPIFAGVLKHPTIDQLRELLIDPVIARKYTWEALRRLPWNALRRFPRAWLAACLVEAGLPDGRRRAVEFMLGSR